mmetsp:Transcript_4656/g.19932  ORF Transcript_4656/g.19932 Transcript_4656/m.19932 type:complete len:81 (-) Transcript_4656:57-299(-)
MKRLQSELEDEKASNKRLNDELSVAVKQLEVSTSVDEAPYSLTDLQYAGRIETTRLLAETGNPGLMKFALVFSRHSFNAV